MSETIKPQGLKTVFISHGGGPLPLLGDPGHLEMNEVLGSLCRNFSPPSAIIVVSAHWETSVATVTSGKSPELIYDYYGFPESAYEITYGAPGNPALAEDIAQALRDSDIEVKSDGARGFDHGLFIPLKIMYPQADIPCVQLSLLSSLNSAQHVRLGQALRKITSENVLVVGSGFSFHNLREFFAEPDENTRAQNHAFNDWLVEICTSKDLAEEKRLEHLIDWESAPSARYCHPREEHLLPLHVCMGIEGRPASKVYQFDVMQRRASVFCWW